MIVFLIENYVCFVAINGFIFNVLIENSSKQELSMCFIKSRECMKNIDNK
jgi:hypothetical protein